MNITTTFQSPTAKSSRRPLHSFGMTMIFLVTCVYPDVVIAAKTPDKLPTVEAPLVLGEVDGDTFDQMTVVNIRFNGKVNWKETPKVEDHGMFLQISLPDTMVTEPGKFIDGPAPHFPKIAIIQATSKDAAVRIFTIKPASLVRESSKTEILGDRLIMTLDHKTLQTLLAKGPGTAEPSFVGPVQPAAKSTVSADEVIAQTTVRNDLTAPSLVLKKEPATSLTGNGSQLDLRGKMTKIAAFSGIMFMLLIATWMAKPYLRKRRRKKASDGGFEPQSLSFETLATMPLSPRQKLMVVQIGNERVLLGVSQDSISFLTNLNQGHQQAFATAAPQIPSNSPAARVLSNIAAKNFSDTFNDESTVNMHPRPVLKNIEGNDPESLRTPVARPTPSLKRPQVKTKSIPPARDPEVETAEKPARNERPGSRLNIRIDDNGATKVAAKSNRSAGRPTKEAEPKKQAIDDITSIIREKLNTLRTI